MTVRCSSSQMRIVNRRDGCMTRKNRREFYMPVTPETNLFVFHRIGIDLVGPLPETSQGNKYLINCTCYFSKWPEAAPLKTKSAKGMDECYIFSLAQRQKNNFLTFRTSNCIVTTHAIIEKS